VTPCGYGNIKDATIDELRDLTDASPDEVAPERARVGARGLGRRSPDALAAGNRVVVSG
jgi:hypothetical protein